MQDITKQIAPSSHRLRLPALWLTVLLTLLCGAIANAAEVSVTRGQIPMVLGPYLDIYEDLSREMNIEDILSGDIAWQRSNQAIPTLGVTDSAFWLYLEITTRDNIADELVISVDAATLDRLDVYFVRNNGISSHVVAGDTVPFSEIDSPYRFPIIPIKLAPIGETTGVIMRAVSTSGIELPIKLSTMAAVATQQQTQLIYFGILFAVFVISFCFCTAYYYNLRDREFLGYMTFFAFSIPLFLSQTGIGRIWFWGESVAMNNRVAYLSAIGLIVSMSLLGQAAGLKTRFKNSIDLVLRFVGYLMLPTAVFFIFAPISAITSGTVLSIMLLGFIMATSIFVISGITAIQGSRPALYLFYSWMAIILAYAFLLAYRLTFIERAETAFMITEGLMILAAVFLLISMIEYVRRKNEQLSQFKLETQTRSDFLRNVSREFLTPVHLILANSKRLLAAQSSDLDEATRQHVNTVIKQSDHLHNLINDLLEMAEIESDSFQPQFELVEMSHFLNEIKRMLLPSAMEKQLQFKTEFASNNLLVQTDAPRLQHALTNIITNAIKFTEHGVVKLGYKAIYFKRRLGVEIFVSDTGKGMSEEFQKQMFKEFARERPVSEKDPQSTGLGMAIVKRMIEKLGGEISFESSLGAGSQFHIRLPLRNQSN